MRKFKHKQKFAGNDSIDFMFKKLPHLMNNLSISRAEILAIQEEKLKNMLAFAKANSPWYKKRLAHINVDKFSLDRLDEIPIMDKRVLMDNWDEIVTVRDVKFNKAGPFLVQEKDYDLFHGVHLFASGGSSGRRGVFLWSADEIADFLAGIYRFQFRDDDLLRNNKQGLRVASVAATRPVHLSETVLALPLNEGMQTLSLSSISPVAQLVMQLNAYQPDYLNGYPSVIKRLAGMALSGNLHISPKRMLLGAEPLTEDMVVEIKKAWPDVVIINQWGSTDAGIHAVSCELSNYKLHVMEDLNILQPVDANYNPVAVGETSSKVIVTNLDRKSMPVLRYEVDDAVCPVAEKCPCGCEFRLIASIEGRMEDDFVYGDKVVLSRIFNYTILPEPGIDEYQIFQTEHGADVHLVAERDKSINTHRITEELVKEYLKLGITDPIINVICVDELDRHPETGKLKRFKTLVNQCASGKIKAA